MAKITLTKPSYLAAASLFTSKDKYRPDIGGVWIEGIQSGGVLLVATDLHHLVIFRDSEGKADRNYIAPVDRALFEAIKFRKDAPAVNLEVRGYALFLGEVDMLSSFVQPFAPIDATFPDWRRVVPEAGKLNHSENSADNLCPAFNPKYLARFSKALKIACGAGTYKSIRIVGNSDGPALVTSEFCNFFGLLMPMRSDAPDHIPFSISPSHKQATQ